MSCETTGLLFQGMVTVKAHHNRTALAVSFKCNHLLVYYLLFKNDVFNQMVLHVVCTVSLI